MTAIADATDSSTVEKLLETIENLRDDLEDAHARIDELETELRQYQDHTGLEFADVRGRITDVEDAVDETAEDDADDPHSEQETETPLERIVSLPAPLADRELSRNQSRARFVARDIRDYSEKCSAGYVIDSRAIKRVLTASEGKRPHTQTVARVMDFLDGLGKDDVELIKRRGRKLVVFDPDAADRLEAAHHDRCDRGGGPNARSDVIGPA